jgi:histidine triad (HIT) family protein
MTTHGVSTRHDPNCLFCKIIEQKVPSQRISEDEHSIAIRDVNPQAPTHILVMPKTHIANLCEVQSSDMLGKLLNHAVQLSKREKLDKGFRIVVNTGVEGGQTVNHLHIHILAGRFMGWPPG